MNYIKLIDSLAKRQEKLLHEHIIIKSERKRNDLSKRIDDLGEQINTIYNVVEELKKHGITDPVINKEGKCYHCEEAIDIENQECAIYQSSRNGSISLFHREHYNLPFAAGVKDPVAIIGRSTEETNSLVDGASSGLALGGTEMVPERKPRPTSSKQRGRATGTQVGTSRLSLTQEEQGLDLGSRPTLGTS